MDAISYRRSVRNFIDKDISREDLKKILIAGQMAPSGKNRQPWKFYISHKNQMRYNIVDEIKKSVNLLIYKYPKRNDLKMALETVDVLSSANIVVFLCYDSNRCYFYDDMRWKLNATDGEVIDVLSIGAVAENMLLRATELGIGSLWCGDILYAYNSIESFFPRNTFVLSALCFGYYNKPVFATNRKPLEEICVYL